MKRIKLYAGWVADLAINLAFALAAGAAFVLATACLCKWGLIPLLRAKGGWAV